MDSKKQKAHTQVCVFFVVKICVVFINQNMKSVYDDEMLPKDFEEIARAYSQSLKKRGFVFVHLDQEELSFLVDEVLICLAKMKACLKNLVHIQSSVLKNKLTEIEFFCCDNFENKKPHNFDCVENENNSFLVLVALENLLVGNLLKLCHKKFYPSVCKKMIEDVCLLFSESVDVSGFVLA